MLIFITGGVRSGKSNFAQKMALDSCADPVYIATAKVWDDDFRKRVEQHQSDRGVEWTTFEAQHGLNRLPVAGRTVVIDCVTLWLTGFFMDNNEDIDACLAGFKTEIDQLCTLPGTFILISNELGMGMHADTAAGRKFADLQGWANQYAAAKAEEVIFMVSGLPLYLKKR